MQTRLHNEMRRYSVYKNLYFLQSLASFKNAAKILKASHKRAHILHEILLQDYILTLDFVFFSIFIDIDKILQDSQSLSR